MSKAFASNSFIEPTVFPILELSLVIIIITCFGALISLVTWFLHFYKPHYV